jgi:ribosomal-protein-alanine N-acetyltransferase
MTDADLAEVLRIERQSFDAPWNRRQFLAAVGGDGVQLNLVLECGDPGRPDRIAGYASAWVVAGEMQINNFAVAEECRRNGHGTRILAHLLEEAARYRCSEVSLEVSRANDGAIRLYEAGGFQKAGIRKGYYRDSGEDALVLKRFL